jgi:hypothetical protein
MLGQFIKNFIKLEAYFQLEVNINKMKEKYMGKKVYIGIYN